MLMARKNGTSGVGAAHAAVWALVGHLDKVLPSTFWFGQGKGEPNYDANGKDRNYEHSSGYALDVMITDLGHSPSKIELTNALKLCAWAQKNASAIGLKWIIFSPYQDGYAYSWNPSRGTWKRLYSGYGNKSAAHMDHVHFYLRGSSFGVIDDSPLQSSVERNVEDMTVQELHKELNDNPMMSLIASRIGMVATALDKVVKQLDVVSEKLSK